MENTRISLTVTPEFSEGLAAVCDHLGVSKSSFIEDYMSFVIEEFLRDLEGTGDGPLVDYIQDRSWPRKDAERMAGILRALPRRPAAVDLRPCPDHAGMWKVNVRFGAAV
jgi:hypothetical protein